MYLSTDIADTLLDSLRDKGYQIAAGLSGEELSTIEDDIGIRFPPDLRLLLSRGVLIDEGGLFPDWRKDPKSIIEKSKSFIIDRFLFDIVNAGYWPEIFGNKPEDNEVAKQKAIGIIESWPSLVPIYGHRFLPSFPVEPGNPVLSVWQPVDTIIYGANITDYLINEFKLDVKLDVPQDIKSIPYWGDAFDLND